MKIDLFKNEIALIKDENIRYLVETCLLKCPCEFWSMPASTSGKHHPSYALGDGGLVRHVKAAVNIASSLLVLEQNSNLDSDLCVAALILHDCVKLGNSNEECEKIHTVHEHPLLAGALIKDTYEELNDKIFISEEDLDALIKMVERHMGQWTTSKYSPEIILEKPETENDKFVHMCDYLASRKFLEVNFEEV